MHAAKGPKTVFRLWITFLWALIRGKTARLFTGLNTDSDCPACSVTPSNCYRLENGNTWGRAD
ncbi:MAG TPA: hypothetical protein DDZ65_08785, partial [Firmicutes bacterium]|nr:hypothetical protein [Bacillota bacterium]